MAGDWIKMRPSLITSPKVNGIARELERSSDVGRALSTGYSGPMCEIVTRNVMRNVTVSALLAVWGAANEHTVDGVFHNADLSDIDDMAGIPGFGEAMASVGWAVFDAEDCSVTLPNFNEYNTCGQSRGPSAKTGAERQKEYRDRLKLRNGDVTRDVTNDVTSDHREEKSREEVIPPNPPSPDGDEGAEADSIPKRERKSRIALKTFLERCKANGVKPVTSYAPLMEYVDGIKLPVEFLELAWDVFKREHMPGGTNERRLQADWQRHFLNYVSKGYYRLWVCKADGSFELTSVGQQAKIREAA